MNSKLTLHINLVTLSKEFRSGCPRKCFWAEEVVSTYLIPMHPFSTPEHIIKPYSFMFSEGRKGALEANGLITVTVDTLVEKLGIESRKTV